MKNRSFLLLLLLGAFSIPARASQTTPIFCDVQAGMTADAKINAATALLPATGGTVDCRGLTGAQTVSGNINMNVANTKYIFADGATFTPTAINLTIVGSANGIEIECGGAGGTVFDWSGPLSTNANPIMNFSTSNIRIHHCTLIGNRLSTGDHGNFAPCIFFQNTGGAQSNIYVEDNFVQNCGGGGIAVLNASNVHILRNKVTQTSNTGIQWNTTNPPATAVPYREIEIAGNVLYDDNTSNNGGARAVGPILVGNSGAQTVQGVVVRNNVVKNNIVGGNAPPFLGKADICNASGTSTATGCGQPIQVNNATFVSILDNIVENTQSECISFTAGDAIVRGNRLNLCGGTVNVNPTTITTAGAGGILMFITDAASPLQNILIDANHITDSGYGVAAILGGSGAVTTDNDVLQNVTISNNVVAKLGQAVIRGIHLDNRTAGTACGGATRQCNFTITNMSIMGNSVLNATTQAYSLKPLTTPGSMIGAPNLSANLGNIGASVIANCNSGASPAVCSGAATGSVAIPINNTTLVVNTTAVTSVSEIRVQFDETLTVTGVTCNAVAASENATYFVNARVPGTSFTIKTSAAPPLGTNPACVSYSIVN
jgi:hypothetical protein